MNKAIDRFQALKIELLQLRNDLKNNNLPIKVEGRSKLINLDGIDDVINLVECISFEVLGNKQGDIE